MLSGATVLLPMSPPVDDDGSYFVLKDLSAPVAP